LIPEVVADEREGCGRRRSARTGRSWTRAKEGGELRTRVNVHGVRHFCKVASGVRREGKRKRERGPEKKLDGRSGTRK